MLIIKYRAFFLWFTGILLAGAISAIVVFGLPLSIEFTGGSLVEVSYTTPRPAVELLKKNLENLALGEISVRESGESAVVLRSRTLTPDEHEKVLAIFKETGDSVAAGETASLTETRFNSIGPALGTELGKKALAALGAVTLAIVLYIAWAFRRVSGPVPGWGYGLVVVAMLAIDIVVPTGFYAAYAHITGAQVDSLFVIALLALLGYCVNDVIVIFDRVREHLTWNSEKKLNESFEDTIGKSIDETMGRSINTALTVAIALIAIIIFGAEATRNFALVMLVGVVAGTFSSICRSAPLLVPIAKHFAKTK